MGLQLQTILNAEDSPTRNVPDTPTSARHQAVHAQQVRCSPPHQTRANKNFSPVCHSLLSIRASAITDSALTQARTSIRDEVALIAA